MDIWGVLGIFPTNDRREIRRAYAAQSKIHHAESDPEGFQRLYRAYQTALEYAKKNQGRQIQPPPVAKKGPVSQRRVIPAAVIRGKLEKGSDASRPQGKKALDASLTGEDGLDFGGIFQEWEKENQEAYYSSGALHTFIDLFSEGKKRFSRKIWQKYIVSEEFLDAQYDPRFVQYLADFLNTQQLVGKNQLPQALCTELFIAYSLFYIQKRVVDEETVRPLAELMRRQETLASTLRKLSSDSALASRQEAFYRYNRLLRCCQESRGRYCLSDWVEVLQFTQKSTLSVEDGSAVPRPPEFFLLLAHLVRRFPLPEEIRTYLYDLYQLDYFERSSSKQELLPLFEELTTPQAREEKEFLKRVRFVYYLLYEAMKKETDPDLALSLLSSEDFQKAMYQPWFLQKLEEIYQYYKGIPPELCLAILQAYQQGNGQEDKLLELLSHYQEGLPDTTIYMKD